MDGHLHRGRGTLWPWMGDRGGWAHRPAVGAHGDDARPQGGVTRLRSMKGRLRRSLHANRVVRDARRGACGWPANAVPVGEQRAGVPRRRGPHPRRAAVRGRSRAGAVAARVRGRLAHGRVSVGRASVVPDPARRWEEAPAHVPRRRPRPALHGGPRGGGSESRLATESRRLWRAA